MQEARRALVMADRVTSNLAAPLLWQLAAELSVAAVAGGAGQQLLATRRQAHVLTNRMLYRMLRQRCDSLQLPPVHLLACQPLRLLAAACALEVAMPPDNPQCVRFGHLIAAVVVSLSSQAELSGRVRAWIPPQQPAACVAGNSSGGCSSDGGSSGGGGGSSACSSGGGNSSDGGSSSRGGGSDGGGNSSGATSSNCGADGSGSGSGSGTGGSSSSNCSSSTCDMSCGADALAGCLAVPLQAAMHCTLCYAPQYAMHALALLRMAAGKHTPKPGALCCPGGGVTGEADGGYRQYAEAVVEIMLESLTDPSVLEIKEPLLPDGSMASDLLKEERDAGRGLLPPSPPSGASGPLLPPPPPPSAPSGPLPPPLELPPGEDGVLPRLRVCGNFGYEGEWALSLKLCGGCRAVRYFGVGCQRAHWRGGHGGACKVLRAGIEG